MALFIEGGFPGRFFKAGLPIDFTDTTRRGYDLKQASEIDTSLRAMGAEVTTDTYMLVLEEDGAPVGVRTMRYQAEGLPTIISTEVLGTGLPVRFHKQNGNSSGNTR